MAWAQALGLGLSALSGLGGLFSKPKPQVTTTNQNSFFDEMQRPVYDSNQLELRNRLINAYLGQMEDEGDYWSGYATQGMANLAQGGDASRRFIENLLASRGIRGGAAGAALAMPVLQQQMQQAGFLNSIPQLVDKRRREVLGETFGFLSSLPTGTSRSGTSQTTGRSETSGGHPSDLGNFLGGMVPSLAWQYGLANQKPPTYNINIPQLPQAPQTGLTAPNVFQTPGVPTQSLPDFLVPKYNTPRP